MSVQQKLQFLSEAFHNMGYQCSVAPVESPNAASFVVEKGDIRAQFVACAVACTKRWRGRDAVLVVEAEKAKMRFPFGHKNPDGQKYRFYMTGLSRAEGDDPKVHSDRLAAKGIAAQICEKLAL